MKPETGNLDRRDQFIAALLWYGTWFATAIIAIGLFLSAFEPLSVELALPLSGHDATRVGIAVFILLPIARVVLMLTMFLCEGDYVYVVVAALVLAIIATGVLVEI